MAQPTFTLQEVNGSTATYTGITGATTGVVAPTTTLDLCGGSSAPAANAVSSSNPVQAGANSYEYWFVFQVSTVAGNSISNLRAWGSAYTIAGVTINMGVTATYAAPVATASTVATTNVSTITTSATALVPTVPANTALANSGFIVIQAITTTSAAGGNVAGMPTINYSYDWS